MHRGSSNNLNTIIIYFHNAKWTNVFNPFFVWPFPNYVFLDSWLVGYLFVFIDVGIITLSIPSRQEFDGSCSSKAILTIKNIHSIKMSVKWHIKLKFPFSCERPPKMGKVPRTVLAFWLHWNFCRPRLWTAEI